MNITKDIKYIGVKDLSIDLFEGLYKVKSGIFYNSYVITDEKVAVMDTVEARFFDEWSNNLKEALGDRTPDYLIVQHMEPDHSANILKFTQLYPEAKVVASAKAFAMCKNFFGTDFAEKQIVVGEGDTLNLGNHNLTFITAPMVHWPEVILTYDSFDKVLFSADAFGKFGTDDNEDWLDEARRYYIGIVGKYGAQVSALLKKAAGLEISKICSLHGPVLSDNLGYYIEKYATWAGYTPEKDGVLIAYTSIYGNTKNAARYLYDKLTEKGIEAKIYDLARTDMYEAVADAFKYSKTVFATTTYNADIFPYMREFIAKLTERNFSNRTVALIENGSWAAMAAKIMRQKLEACKNITFAENQVTVMSAMSDDNKLKLDALAEELSK
ncbi:MAG: FprA family A-type flavoprotein [Clostridia bacterium]|nr:FprA family A-type flavoprotein [Clostridia bacterium]